MLTVIETNLVERELTIGKKTAAICLNTLKDALSKAVGAYQDFSLHYNFQELIAVSILYLETLATHAPSLTLSKEMILSAAQEIEKSCRRCLERILFEKGPYDLEAESAESGIRLSVLQIANMVSELGLSKENLLFEKSQVEIKGNLQSLNPQLIPAFTRIIEDSVTTIQFIDKRHPASSLLVTSQGYVGYLIGIIARITKKEVNDFLDFPAK